MFGLFKKKERNFAPHRFQFDYYHLPEYFWKMKSEFFGRLENEGEAFFHELMVDSYERSLECCKALDAWFFYVEKHQIDASTEAITVKYDSRFNPLDREDLWYGGEVGGTTMMKFGDDLDGEFEVPNHAVMICNTYIFLRHKLPSGKYEMRYWAIEENPRIRDQNLVCFRNPSKKRDQKITSLRYWICDWNCFDMDRTLNFVKLYSEDKKFRKQVERTVNKFSERRKLAWEDTLCEE